MSVYSPGGVVLGLPGMITSFSSVLPFGAHETKNPGKLPESLLGERSAFFSFCVQLSGADLTL